VKGAPAAAADESSDVALLLIRIGSGFAFWTSVRLPIATDRERREGRSSTQKLVKEAKSRAVMNALTDVDVI